MKPYKAWVITGERGGSPVMSVTNDAGGSPQPLAVFDTRAAAEAHGRFYAYRTRVVRVEIRELPRKVTK